MKKQQTSNPTFETNRRIRRDWGDISPVTRIIPDKREQKRRKQILKETRNYTTD